MKYIAMPDPTTLAFSVLLVLALATPYLLVRYLMRHRTGVR
jgi:hypothetical protein